MTTAQSEGACKSPVFMEATQTAPQCYAPSTYRTWKAMIARAIHSTKPHLLFAAILFTNWSAIVLDDIQLNMRNSTNNCGSKFPVASYELAWDWNDRFFHWLENLPFPFHRSSKALNRLLLRTYHVSGTVSSTRDPKINKTIFLSSRTYGIIGWDEHIPRQM